MCESACVSMCECVNVYASVVYDTSSVSDVRLLSCCSAPDSACAPTLPIELYLVY